MAGPDLNEILQRRANAAPSGGSSFDKAVQLQAARQAKGAAMLERIASVEMKLSGHQNSWVNKLGLDPDGVAGGVVNLTANVVSGTTRLAGDIASMPFDATAMSQDLRLDQGHLDAYNRATQGKATEADLTLLQKPDGSGTSALDRLNLANKARSTGKQIDEATDFSGIVHSGNKDRLVNDLGSAFDGSWGQIKQGAASLKDGNLVDGVVDGAAGLAKLIYNSGKAAISNPMGVTEFVAENAPQLAIGAAGMPGKVAMVTSNVGYGIENYRKGVEDFRKANNGAMPSEDQLQHMAKMSAAAAIAEHAGDAASLFNMKALSREARAAAKAAGAAEDELRTGFKAALRNVNSAGAKGFAEEALTEGFQTYAENEAQLKEADAKDIYVGGVIGGLSGGAMSAGGRAVSELAQATPEHAADRQKKAETFVNAADTGDVSPYTKLGDKSYDPTKALQALHANAQKEDSTAESRQQNYREAAKTIADYDKAIQEFAAGTPSIKKDIQDLLVSRQEELRALPEDATEEAKASLQTEVDRLQRLSEVPIAQGKELVTIAKRRQEMEDTRDTLYDQLFQLKDYNASRKDPDVEAPADGAEAQAAPEPVAPEAQAQPEVLDPTATTTEPAMLVRDGKDSWADLDLAKTPPKADDLEGLTAHKDAAARVVVRSMAAPDDLSSEDALSLADNMDNGLSDTQRSYLRSVSQSRLDRNALQDMGKVTEEILYGNPAQGQLGIDTYRKRMGVAIDADNQVIAEQQLRGLTRFADGHLEKMTALQEAWAKFEATGEASQVLPSKDGSWVVEPLELSKKELQQVQGYDVSANSKNFIKRVEMESKALDSAVMELTLAKQLKFNPQSATAAEATTSQTAESQATPSTQGVEAAASGVSGQQAPQEDPALAAALPDAPKVEEQLQTAELPVADSQAEPATTPEQSLPDQVTLESVKANPKAGALAAFSESQVDAEGNALGYQKANLVAKNLEQEAQGKNEGSFRPLVAVPNFMSQVKAGKVDLAAFTDAHTTADEATKINQTRALEAFTQFAETAAPLFQANLHLPVKVGTNAPINWDNPEEAKAISKARKNAANRAKQGKTTPVTDQEDFQFNDMMKFLQQKTVGADGKPQLHLEENVSTAMSFAGFSHVVEGSQRDIVNDPEAINQALRRPADTAVSAREEEFFASAGVRANVMYGALGRKFSQALGFKLKADAPQGDLERLQVAVGAHIAKMMEDGAPGMQPLLVRQSYTADQLVEAGINLGNIPSDETMEFLSFATDAKGNLAVNVQQLVDSAKGSKGFLESVFSVDPGVIAPTLEPQKFTQKKAKNSKKYVPKWLAKTLDRSQHQGFSLRQDYWNLFQDARDTLGNPAGFTAELMYEIAGVEEEDDLTHVTKLKGKQAKNASIRRGVDNFFNFIEDTIRPSKDGLDAVMYFEHQVWKQQRVGIKTNLINPQANKFHRAMLTKASWEMRVRVDSAAEMRSFKLRVLEGLGVKTDKELNAKSLAGFDATFDSSKVTELDPNKAEKLKERADILNRAVDALVTSLRTDPLTEEQKRDVLLGVRAGGEKMHSLDSLMAMAQWRYALETQATSGKPISFITNITGEVDGVTNGPMLSHILLGAASSAKELFAKINRGGFFQEGSGSKNYNYFRSQEGNNDLYESTIVKVIAQSLPVVLAMMDPKKKWAAAKNLSAIEYFLGELVKDGKAVKDGRKAIKTPLTAFTFGSSPFRSAEAMAQDFVEKIYDKMEALAREKKPITPAIAELNKLLWDDSALPASMTYTEFKDFRFSTEQLKKINFAFRSTMGAAVEMTLKSEFAELIQRRDVMNQAAKVSHHLFDAVYQGIRAHYVAELAKLGQLAKGADGKPYHDLSQAQEAKLQALIKDAAPVLHTYMSKEEGNLDAGLAISKTRRGVTDNPHYANEVKFGKPYAKKKATGGDKFSVQARGQALLNEAPGLAMPPMATHSLDSAISHMAAELGDILNVHDAHVTGLANYYSTAQKLNAATWKALLHYSPLTEMAESLDRTITGINKIMAGKRVPQESKDAFIAALREVQKSAHAALKIKVLNEAANTGKSEEEMKTMVEAALAKLPLSGVLSHVVQAIHAQAREADLIRLEAMSMMTYVDQYAAEGGEYAVTDADRAMAKKMLQALRDAPSKVEASMAQAHQVMSHFGGSNVGSDATVLAVDPAKDVAVRENDDNGPPINWDEAGKSMPDADAAQIALEIENSLEASETLKQSAKAIRVSLESKKVRSADEALATVSTSPELGRVMRDIRQEAQAPAWAELGVSRVQAEPWIEGLFSQSPTVSAHLVLDRMAEHLKAGRTNNAKAQLMLVNQLKRSVPKDIKVTHVTAGTAWETVGQLPTSASHGWFTPDFFEPKNGEIFLMGSDFKKSALTGELVLHEMVHAATLMALDSGNPKLDPQLNALADLLDAARALVEGSPELKNFAPAVTDVHELVAYGMTNRLFQQKVLAKLQMPAGEKSLGQKMLTGLQAFIERLTDLVFADVHLSEKQRKDASNGLAVLIDNVSTVMESLAKEPTAMQRVTNRVLSMAAPDPATKTYKYTTQQIFDALGNLDGPAQNYRHFKEYLNGVLDTVVFNLHGPFGLVKTEQQSTQALTPLDVWQKALDQGHAPFASEIQAGPFRTSPQEAFVIEQVEVAVKELLDHPDAHGTATYKELHRLYQEARKVLKPSDFESQAQYDFLFKVDAQSSKRSDYMARFMAMGMAHSTVHAKLEYAARTPAGHKADRTLLERIQDAVNDVMTWLRDTLFKFDGNETVNQRMNAMVRRLVDIEAKKRRMLMMKSPLSKFNVVEEKISDFVDKVKLGALKLTETETVKNSNSYVRGAAAAVQIYLEDRAEQVMDLLQQMRDRYMQERHGWITGLLNELRGVPATVQGLIRMAKKNEQDRKRHIEDVATFSRDAFTYAGAQEDAGVQQAITNTFLRTGMHTLLEGKPAAEGIRYVQDLVEHPSKVGNEIQARIKALGEFPQLRHYFVNQSKALGYFMATGRVRSALLMLNAGNIVQLHGTGKVSNLTQEQSAVAEKLVDELTSLYALAYTSEIDLGAAKEVLRHEMQRQDGGNGVHQVILLHKKLEEDSRARLFESGDIQMMKGYLPDIRNPHTAIAVARTPEEHQSLLEQGYVTTDDQRLQLDRDDPDRRTGQIYVLKDGGLLPRVTGAISWKGMHARGSKNDTQVASGLDVPGMELVGRHVDVTHRRASQVASLFQAQPHWDPAQDFQSRMAPVMNSKGEVTAWRYLMEATTKDHLLERDNRFDQVLGALAGSIVDKEETASQNAEVIKALKDLYDSDFTKRPHSFVRVSHDSSDPEMREIYRLLPDVTKRELERVWGKTAPFMVPRELIHPVFGYRKWSLSSGFDKKQRNLDADRRGEARDSKDELSNAEELLTNLVEQALYGIARTKGMTQAAAEVYSRRGGVLVRRGEQYWQALVSLTKDIIVVKGISVMWGNIRDNLSMLVLQGVSPKNLIRWHIQAIRGALDYKRERNELAQLQLRLEAGDLHGDAAELKAQIAILEDSLARNPVRDLIDAGLMPTIAEDVNPVEDIYSYKSRFERKVSHISSKINPTVLEAGKWALMTHDTPLYKGLNQITQLSDFVGRYVLYQHLTTQAKEPLSKADAIQKASDVFVNYDIPMHPGMQYLDDHGFMMFTKYFLRIQRVLRHLVHEQPARILAGTLLQRYLHALPMPTQSSIVYRIGNNPMTGGALRLPGTVDEIATFKALSMLF